MNDVALRGSIVNGCPRDLVVFRDLANRDGWTFHQPPRHPNGRVGQRRDGLVAQPELPLLAQLGLSDNRFIAVKRFLNRRQDT